jgi:two-component system sensor kinase FixL
MELQIGEVRLPGTRFFTGFVRDLTERQEHDRRLSELQAELIHVSRFSELGQMVSALAHEVNQPLTAIANYVSGSTRLLGPEAPPALRQALVKISQQAERARAIVNSLRGFVRREPEAPTIANLEAVIEETSALALAGTGRSITFLLQVAPDARFGLIQKVPIQQVLLNLMRNAVEAMAASPVRRLSVSTRRDGDMVEITVSDTGPGLAETVRARLFEPFVTTKHQGLGVGLSICRTIVETYGSTLRLVRTGPDGTAFAFTVPASDAPPD